MQLVIHLSRCSPLNWSPHLVGGQELEGPRRVGDHVALGARVQTRRGVAEPRAKVYRGFKRFYVFTCRALHRGLQSF